MKPVEFRFSYCALFASLLFACASSAHAQDAVASFYKGRAVKIVIGSDAGGGYDTYARLIGRYIGAYIPGHPTIVPQNMPGAGAATATHYVAAIAPKDGTVIGATHPGAILERLLGDKRKAQYDPSTFQYIGNANSDVYVCVIRTDAPVKTFSDAFTKQFIVGTAGEGASTNSFPLMLDNVLGTKIKIVRGYLGNRLVQLAIEKGELQGECGTSWSSISSAHPDWFKTKMVKVLVQESAAGYPELNKMGVPHTVDFAKTAEQRQVLELVYSQEVFGRPYFMAAGVPKERVAAIRKAFSETFKDPRFLAEAKRTKLDVVPLSGAKLQAIISKIFATPPHVVDLARKAVGAAM